MIILFNLRQFDLALNYGFRSKQAVEDAFDNNPVLYTRAELIRKQYDQLYSNYNLIDKATFDELNANAYHLIIDLLEAVKEYEPETADTWCSQMEERQAVEEKLHQNALQLINNIQQNQAL